MKIYLSSKPAVRDRKRVKAKDGKGLPANQNPMLMDIINGSDTAKRGKRLREWIRGNET
ncbi:predicted protein [Sclerotinia sclerotiorum 1980 UF-70]|uniref:Uncharacterized protein n=1 Tax=Sclerotinia sclerotiorum (strain ATCC 18683 / 1980 / Ss-1) TaxID=665079 RepID=A7EWU3_SCLS1|nr:predicted protein [Sclerotinia sclerotiorum 1980 UF-70]EDN93935.1 predicted protein [Sclerotinia sclerotiorum 1980 UF-70]